METHFKLRLLLLSLGPFSQQIRKRSEARRSQEPPPPSQQEEEDEDAEYRSSGRRRRGAHGVAPHERTLHGRRGDVSVRAPLVGRVRRVRDRVREGVPQSREQSRARAAPLRGTRASISYVCVIDGNWLLFSRIVLCGCIQFTQAFSDNLDRIKAHNDMYARGEYSFELGVNRK